MDKIFTIIDRILTGRTFVQINVICLLMITLIARLDVMSGYEISLAILFLVPIAMSTWYGSYRTGMVYSVLCAIIWFAIDGLFFSHPYVNSVAPYWNFAVRLGVFLIMVALLNRLRVQLDIEKALSRTDALTKLLNARGFAEQAEKLFNVAARHGRHITLAYIDLDDFKRVNEVSGRREGDKVLRVVGERICSSLRVSDVAGRVGGDEFAIVLPETDEAGAKVALDTFRNVLLQKMKTYGWPIKFSIGVATFNSTRANLEDAIRTADSLMYQVKTGGKNNIAFATYPAK